MKEAYEFSILNPFLINEEELHNLIEELNAEDLNSGGNYASGANNLMLLDLHQPDGTREESSSEDEQLSTPNKGNPSEKPTAVGTKFKFTKNMTSGSV